VGGGREIWCEEGRCVEVGSRCCGHFWGVDVGWRGVVSMVWCCRCWLYELYETSGI
jgi:hypothetical protein